MKIHNDYDIRPIAAAVIVQAVRDAREGSRDARAWLLGDGLLWLDICGIEYTPAQLQRRLQKSRRQSRNHKRRASSKLLTITS